MSEYVAVDHFGITDPGEELEGGRERRSGADRADPVNRAAASSGSGTRRDDGVRMVHDARRQVTGRAGECQVEGARNFATHETSAGA